MEAEESNNISNYSSNPDIISNVTLDLFMSGADRWLTFTFLALALTVALVANTTAIVLFAIRSKYKKPVHVILVSLCFFDITIALATLPWKLLVAWLNTLEVLQYASCPVNIVSSATAQLSCYHVLTLLAVERYYFFCRPYAYEELFTVKRMVVCVVCIIAVAGITVSSHIFTDNKIIIHSPVILICYMKDHTVGAAVLAMVMYVIPKVVSMAFAAIKIYKLSCSKVCPVPGDHAQVQRSNPAMSTLKVRRSLRVMLMLSGVFLLTNVPSNLVTTEDHVSYGRLHVHFYASDPRMQFVRIANHIVHTVSPAIDPLIYLYTYKSLYIVTNHIPGQ